MSNTRKYLLIIFFITGYAHAQEVRLTLKEAIDAALQNNREVAIASLDEQSSRAKYNQTQAVFLPQVKLSYTAMSTNNPLNAFGFKLQQQSIQGSDFDPARLNNPSATHNFMTKAEFVQPIVNMDLLYMRAAAHSQQEAMAYKSERTKQYVVLQVETAYAQLQLAHHARQVMQQTLATINAIYRATNNRYEEGYLQKSDILQVQVQVATTESKLAEVNSNIQNASDYLSLLLGAPAKSVYAVDSVDLHILHVADEGSVPAGRSDFMAMQSAVSAHEQMMHAAKMSYVPKLNAFGEYLFNDKEALGFGSNAYLVGAQLSWAVFNGMASRNKVAEQRVERDKALQQLAYQREQAQTELNKTMRQMHDAQSGIASHEVAVKYASEALRIIQNRHEQGLVSTNDLLQAQTELSQQKLGLAQAVYQLQLANAYMSFLTSSNEK